MVNRPFLLITASALFYFIAYAMTIPTLPRFVERDLGHGDVAVGIVVGIFAFSALLLRPLAGILSDQRGRRLIITSGALLVAASSASIIPMSSVVPVTFARFVTGIGEAMFFVGCVSAINDIAPPERRGEAVSLFSVALYLGIAIGPSIGEAIDEAAGFDQVLAVSASLCVVAFLLGLFVGETRPLHLPPHQGKRRIVHPSGIWPGIVMFTSVYGFAGYMAFMPLYVDELGLSGARWVLVLYGGILVAIRLFGARLPDVLGVERAGLIGLTLSTAGLAVIGLWHHVAGLLAGTGVFATGQALAFPAFMALAAGRAPPAERGAAVGTTTAFIDLGFGVGPLTLGVVAASFTDQATFLVSSLVAVSGVGLQLLARKRERMPA